MVTVNILETLKVLHEMIGTNVWKEEYTLKVS